MAGTEQTSEQAAKAGTPKASKSKAKNGQAKKGGALTADQIFSLEDVRKEKLDIPEWDGYVWVHGLTSGAHEKLVQSCMKGDVAKGDREFDMVGYQSKLVVLCSRDDDGNRILSDGHVAQIMEKASSVVSRIAQKAQELSGIGGEAVAAIKADLEKTTSSDSLTV